ncbi:MAG TPA: hypothetical protein VFW78_09310 [Bacteroidia bacterium]|nr:hypothetical protein [Bacteroidia bacterium]
MPDIPLRFVYVRLLQASRELYYAGFLRGCIVMLLGGLSLYLFGFSQLLVRTSGIGVGMLVLIVFLINNQRGDQKFLLLTGFKPWKIKATEYVVFTLPFVVTGLLFGSFAALIILPAVVIISLLPGRERSVSGSNYLSDRIPLKLFEWRAGSRVNKISFTVCYFGALLFAPLPYVSLVFIWLFTSLVSSFYYENESRELLFANFSTPKQFLNEKLGAQFRFGTFVLIIPIGVHLLFKSHEWIPALVVFVLSVINLLVFVVSKYAVWKPGATGNTNEITFSLSSVSIVVPFLVPIPLFYLIWNYFRAVKNLNAYRNVNA